MRRWWRSPWISANFKLLSRVENSRSEKVGKPLISTRIAIFLLQFEILNTSDFDISFRSSHFSSKLCKMAENGWKWRKIAYLGNGTSPGDPSFWAKLSYFYCNLKYQAILTSTWVPKAAIFSWKTGYVKWLKMNGQGTVVNLWLNIYD